ncbi:MAG TPA: hypothetical protein VGG27_12370 [Magnetospirillaceae bacterium]|jgi:hypothetical protein
MSSLAATKGRRSASGKEDRPLISPLLMLVFGLSLLGLLAAYSSESLLLLGIGMLPTVGAAFAGRKEKGVWISVGWLNFAGLSNWLLDLWSSDHTLSYATAQLRTVAPILVAYAAAALGWFLYLAMPAVARGIIAASLRRRKANLVGKQRALVDQWDNGITTFKPVAVEKRNAPRA